MKRIILISLAAVVVLFSLWAYFFGDSWLAGFNEEREQAAQEQRDLGEALGRTTNQNGCFEQALVDIADCRSPICTIDTGNFLRGCWATSAPSEDICTDVPEYNEEITEDEKSWARYGCWEMNNKSDGCRILMRQKQQLCQAQSAN